MQSDIVDGDAIAIGDLYERSKVSFLDSVNAGLECGQRLAEKKASLAHGEWTPWLEANAGVGVPAILTAQRLMKAAKANTSPATHLDVAEALKLSREMWGHKGEGVHVAANSGNNEWYTPPDVLDLARMVLGGFDLDPASSLIANKTVKASKIFTAEDDGLSQEWPVGRIWMNPPYAQPLITQFCERFAAEMARGSTGIALVNNATETAWFNALAGRSSAICFLRGRVRYLNPAGEPEGAPLQGQAVIYSGPDSSAFREQFRDAGFIVGPLP